MSSQRMMPESIEWLNEWGFSSLTATDVSWPRGAKVYRLEDGSSTAVYLKQFSSPRKFSQAVHVYQNWLPRINQGALQTPMLIASNESARAILISDVGPAQTEFLQASADHQLQFMNAAGQFLKQFHAIEFEDKDSLPIGDALLHRARHCQTQFAKLQPQRSFPSHQQIADVTQGIAEIVSALNQFKRVPCHRDFWRRNWIVDTSSVIDFEHSQPDLFLLDFLNMKADLWLERPEFEAAFWQGYGWQPDQSTQRLLDRCGALHALQTFLWAYQNDDLTFLEQGRRLLAASISQ